MTHGGGGGGGMIANPNDDAGEAYYKLEGTNKTFEIRVRMRSDEDFYKTRTIIDLKGMGLGERDYGNPAPETPVTLVITGSEAYGYISSLDFGPKEKYNWMRQMYDVIKDRELRHVVVPGSHDAGMSRISGAESGWNYFGTSQNSQNQGLATYNQLRFGARYFDMRLVSVNNADFWVAHINEPISPAPLGATGESLDDVINGLNRFTSESPGEIIVFWVSYMTNLAGPLTNRIWRAEKANEFYTELERINNRCPGFGSGTKFDRLRAGELMDKNNGHGCVLIQIDSAYLDSGVPRERPESGIYWAGNNMERDDYWANKENVQDLAQAQVSHMEENVRDGGSNTKDKYAIMQWQTTPEVIPTVSLEFDAVLQTNPALYWYAVNRMGPDMWPTVIMQDYLGYIHMEEGEFPSQLGAELRALCIGLNLYMVSQNCKANGGTHPLLP